MWGRGVLPAALPAVYLCANVGPQGLLVVRMPAPFVPHSASLSPATATRVLSSPVPVSAPPTGLDECLFFISLVLDFLAVQFSVSSGFARRRSVSTYAAILVFSACMFLAPVGLSSELSCEAGSFSCCRLNPHGCFQSEV